MKAALWRLSGHGSFARPPTENRLKLSVHRVRSRSSSFFMSSLAMTPSAAGQYGVASLGESGGSDAILEARGLQIGTTKPLEQ